MIFLVWQGFGILGPLIAMAGYVIVAFAVRALAGNSYLLQHSWPGAFGTLIGAGAVWILNRRLEQRPGQVVVDPQTGQAFEIKRRHTFFGVPLRYQAIIFAVVAVGMLVLKHESSL